jgi:hypothetical protein
MGRGGRGEEGLEGGRLWRDCWSWRWTWLCLGGWYAYVDEGVDGHDAFDLECSLTWPWRWVIDITRYDGLLKIRYLGMLCLYINKHGI